MCANHGIKLSLFIAPDEAHVRLSRELGARQVEFHTGEYCHKHGAERITELERLKRAATLAHSLGLEVAAGHGLTRFNVLDIAAIPEIEELNIGHSVIGDAVLIGLDRAVRDLRSAIARGLTQRAARGQSLQ
jgi:pyridoxine 5-phosphate synthase